MVLAPTLLRGHVRDLPLERAGAGARLPLERLRHPEVDDLHAALVGDEHVRGRDVAVHDPERTSVRGHLLVGVVQAGADPDGDRDRLVERHLSARVPAGGEHLLQALAVDVLHREEVAALDRPDVVDLRHVRVLQQRREPRLVEEHVHEIGALRVLGQDALQHDELLEALEPGDARQVDLGHAADGQAAEHLVAAESTPGSEELRDHAAPGSGVRGALVQGRRPGPQATLPCRTRRRLQGWPACPTPVT